MDVSFIFSIILSFIIIMFVSLFVRLFVSTKFLSLSLPLSLSLFLPPSYPPSFRIPLSCFFLAPSPRLSFSLSLTNYHPHPQLTTLPPASSPNPTPHTPHLTPHTPTRSLPSSCTIQNSVLSAGCVIESNCNINECYTGSLTKIAAGSKIKGESISANS